MGSGLFRLTSGKIGFDPGFLLDKVQAEQILDLRSVDLLRPTPLELIQGLEHREAGTPDALREAFILAARHFAFDQTLQVIEVLP